MVIQYQHNPSTYIGSHYHKFINI